MNITIPPEALKAAEAEILAGIARGSTSDEIARAACLAMLEAWPGMGTVATEDHTGIWPKIILPLPQENSNERK